MHPAKEIKGIKSKKLDGKKIALGVTGSIAAVECVKLIRELIRHGADVYPVVSQAAQGIVTSTSLEYASGRKPITEITGGVEHVALCGEVNDKTDLFLIAPCTANTISKIAVGIDDTPVTSFATTAIGSDIPIMLVPAMHFSMYKHPIVKEHLKKLESIGIETVKPLIEEGVVKMPDIETIVEAVLRKLGKKDLARRKILIVGGSTAEAIDDVRIITNKSTGITALELTREAYERGADATLIYGRGAEPPAYMRTSINVLRVENTNEMLTAVRAEAAKKYDAIIVCAAISDYYVAPTKGKISSNLKELTLKLKPTPKIIEEVRKMSNCYLVGFKAEYGVDKNELIERAYKRLKDLDADLMVANDLAEVTAYKNHVYLIDNEKKIEEIKESKGTIAERLLTIVAAQVEKVKKSGRGSERL